MAKYRQIHTHIWKDEWFLDLEPEFKLFFIYLFSNERASISGIYELAFRVMMFESGLTKSKIMEAFELFKQDGKAFYDDGVVWVPNLRKYHETKSPKVQTAIKNDYVSLRICYLKGMYADRYGIDRVSDTLSIPSISSSSSSSSSSKNGDKPPIYDQHEENNPPPSVKEYCSALAIVSKTPYGPGVNEDDYETRAAWCINNGVSLDDINRFPDYWRDNGYYKGKPSLKTVTDEIQNMTQPVKQKEWYE